MMQLKPYFGQIYFLSTSGLLCITLLISMPELYTYDLVEFYSNDPNRTVVILCDIKVENIQVHETFRFHHCIVTLIIPFFLIIFVNLIIGLGLKRRNSLISNDLLMSMEQNLRKSSSKVKNNLDGMINSTPRESLNVPLATISEVNLSEIETERHLINENTLTRRVSKETKRKGTFLNKIRKRNSNTNLLATVTTVYAFFNLPYIFNLFYIYVNLDKFSKIPHTPQAFSIASNFQTSVAFGSNTVELFKYRYYVVALFSEILYVANYSLNGLLLFAFGKIYQIHLKSLIKKYTWSNLR